MPLDEAVTVADPSAEFADLTALRLDLTGQRREVAEAAGWLDAENRELLGLWWLSEHGQLDRAELAATIGVPQNQAAVRIQRLKQQLSATRVVVRALRAPERCRGLLDLTSGWDGHRNALWRKRFVGHTRDCEICDARSRDLVPVEKLLAGLPMAAVPTALAAAVFREAMAAGVRSGAAGSGGTSGLAHGSGAKALGHGSGKIIGLLPAKASVVIAAATASVVAVAATAVWAASGSSGTVPGPTPVAAGTSTTASPSAVAAASPTPVSTSVSTSTPSPSHTPAPTTKASPTPTKSAVAPPPSHPAVSGPKKGVGVWSAPDLDASLTASKASWYYDWSPSRLDHIGSGAPQFVPMIWGAKNADAATLATAKSQGSVLLGFNEPDMGSQSNMTAQQALDLWPKLQATGLRLGSPAVAARRRDAAGGWLDQFMTGAAAAATASTSSPCTGTARTSGRARRPTSSSRTSRPSTTATTCRSGSPSTR